MQEKHIPESAKGSVHLKETPKKDVPARDAFHHHAMKDLQSKLSECFLKMNETEVDIKFNIGDTDVRIFGFRARKGITIPGDAYTEITGFGSESGGSASIHLRTGLFFKGVRYNAFDEPDAHTRARLLRPGALGRLRERDEFRNLISLLDFLESQNIKYSFILAKSSDDWYANNTKKKYELALSVKTLENNHSKPDEAVQKVLNSLKRPSALLSQLNEHNMKEEAHFLAGITREHSESHFDNLVYIWSNHPPANPEDIAFAIAGVDMEKLKKFIEKAIADKDAKIRMMTKEADNLSTQAQSSTGILSKYLEENFTEKKREVKEEITHLENLRKAYKVLCSSES